ncbi:hypothetical protein Pelo_18562 [Pelomyxa schiedti]|nr:hypothetical protein Pelo_18562 [Pelomyxa schiedti]
MYVSVSPTLGVVTHRWYTCTMIDCGPAVVGCLGGDMVLHSWSDPGSDAYYGGLRKYDAVDLRCMPEPPQVTPAPPPSDEGSSCCFLTAASDMSVICNRKWVVDGHPLPSSTPTLSFFIFERYSSEKILFAPWCGDIVMLKSAHDITLVDLEESFRREELVLTLRTSSPSQFDNLLGLLWGPDGSMFTLHTTDALASCAAVDCATGESHLFSPNVSLVEVFGRDHTFTVVHPGAFQVHHTGNNLTVPSLNVPCTWAQHKSGLILSTTQKSRGNGKVHLSLHDGFTGTHIGDFNVPLPPNFLFHLRIKL